MPVLFEFFRELSSSSFGSGEDDGGIKIILTEKVSQHLDLAFLANRIECMFDGLCRHRVVDLGNERVVQDLFSQLADLFRHGGGKKQVLAFGGEFLNDSSDVREKAHVEHVIGFVKDQGFDLRQVDESTAQQIE